MRGVSFDIDATRDDSSFQGFKLFGTAIRTGDVQGEGNAKGSDPPEKLSGKALQCPRCKSMETKFFYFNNYNINQPRHFCRGCQRYWTAGGSEPEERTIWSRPPQVPTAGYRVRRRGNLSEAKELGLEGEVEQWHVSTSGSSKRRNNSSSGQVG